MGFPGSSVGKESAFNAGEPSWIPESGRSSGEGIGYSPVFLSFTCGSAGKESACNAGDLGSIPGLGRCPGEGKGYPLQCSGLYSPWGRKELDTTERLALHFIVYICLEFKSTLSWVPLGFKGQLKHL